MTTKKYRESHIYCEVCGVPSQCVHHIKTVGSGGMDEEDNYIALCFVHHTEVHKIGRWKFSDKYNLNWEEKATRKYLGRTNADY